MLKETTGPFDGGFELTTDQYQVRYYIQCATQPVEDILVLESLFDVLHWRL